jgi:predicted RNA-binding protein with PIN domain
MLDDELLDSLPEDTDEGLAKLYRYLKSDIEQRRETAEMNQQNFNLEEARRTLLNTLSAYVSAHAIPVQLDIETFPLNSESFDAFFIRAIETIEFYIAKTSFERSAREKSGNSAIYVLSASLKREIHHHLGSVRELIAEAELSDTKRIALSKKLNAFAEEVDRNKTRVESLASAIIWTRKESVEGVRGLEPIVEKLDKMFQSFSKATEFFKLPSGDKPKQLPPPPKRIEGPKNDFGKADDPF